MWSRVKVMVWLERVMLHSSQYVLPTWTHIMCFYRSSMPLSKVIAKKLLGTFHNLRWPRGDIKRGHGCRFPIQCVKFTCYLLHNVCSEWRSSKTVALQFSHIYLLVGYMHFMHTVTCINRCKFQCDRSVSVASSYDEHYNYFSEARSLDMTWRPTLGDLGVKFLHMRKRSWPSSVKNKNTGVLKVMEHPRASSS